MNREDYREIRSIVSSIEEDTKQLKHHTKRVLEGLRRLHTLLSSFPDFERQIQRNIRDFQNQDRILQRFDLLRRIRRRFQDFEYLIATEERESQSLNETLDDASKNLRESHFDLDSLLNALHRRIES